MTVKITWQYHRKGWTTCKKAQEFLEPINHTITETIDASKTKIGLKEALVLAKKASTIIAAKGSKITTLDLKKDKPSDEDIAGLIMGPTGNLRAPTLLAGNTLYVGFNEEAYKKLCS